MEIFRGIYLHHTAYIQQEYGFKLDIFPILYLPQ